MDVGIKKVFKPAALSKNIFLALEIPLRLEKVEVPGKKLFVKKI